MTTATYQVQLLDDKTVTLQADGLYMVRGADGTLQAWTPAGILACWAPREWRAYGRDRVPPVDGAAVATSTATSAP